jgi:hypothetical protein
MWQVLPVPRGQHFPLPSSSACCPSTHPLHPCTLGPACSLPPLLQPSLHRNLPGPAVGKWTLRYTGCILGEEVLESSSCLLDRSL